MTRFSELIEMFSLYGFYLTGLERTSNRRLTVYRRCVFVVYAGDWVSSGQVRSSSVNWNGLDREGMEEVRWTEYTGLNE